MLKAIKKIPAGTFLIPMIISMILFTFWPDLFKVGGITESLLSGSGIGFITGMLAFASGTTIDFKGLKELLKHQGSLVLIKLVLAIVLSFAFLYLFGHEGIWGISGVAFVAVIFSVNPSVQVSILASYGYEKDTGILAISGLLTLPIFSLLVYSMYASGGGVGSMDWTPFLSALIPLILGIILGNIDKNFAGLFGPAVGALLPLLGWNLGQTMNFIEALQAGPSGILLTVIFVILMLPLYFADTKLLGHDGISGIAMITTAGMSTIIPPTIAAAYPEVAQYVTSANSQILFATIILAVLSPILAKRRYKKVYETEEPQEHQESQVSTK